MAHDYGMDGLERRTKELFGASAAEALAILTGEMRGIPRESLERVRAQMVWLANGEMTELRKLQTNASRDWRDIESEYQSEVSLERARVPPKRNWTL